MDLQEFRQSLGQSAPPRGIQPPLKALWHDAKNEWDQAHNIVQQEDDAASAWVHAYLHRKEGDDGNAGYWYRAKPPCQRSAHETLGSIALALLCEHKP